MFNLGPLGVLVGLLLIGAAVVVLLVLIATARRGAAAAGRGSDAGAPAGGMVDQLGRLVELHRQGALSDEEFATAKDRLLR